MKPQRYEILRQVPNETAARTPVAERPEQVWTLLDEPGFEKIGLVHWRTGFIEDQMHDWDWRDGHLRFYAHSSDRGELVDLVLVYEK